MSELEVELVKLRQENKELKERLAKQDEMLRLLLRAQHSPKSEKSRKAQPAGEEEQLSLFNEAEAEAKPQEPEPAINETTVKTHTRKRKAKREETLTKDMPHEKILLTLDEDQLTCQRHPDTQMEPFAEELVRSEVMYTPAKLTVVDIYRQKYRCKACQDEDRVGITSTPIPASLLPHSIATPALAARVLSNKFVLALPFYRQEKQWANLGLGLSRATMANWAIALHKYYFDSLVKHMRTVLLGSGVLHADETPVQVHHESKERSKRKKQQSYMWLYATSPLELGRPPIRLFEYQPGRSGDYAVKFLAGFHGVLIHDQFAGYNKLGEVTHAGCWAHLRRRFVEVASTAGKNDDKAKQKRTAISQQAIAKMEPIYALEEKAKTLTPEERRELRLSQEKPLVEAFFAWAETVLPQIAPKCKLAEAFRYAIKAKDSLCVYLDNGCVSMTNNPAENAIRPFTIGRKNWLFSDSPRGAEASAAIYSLVETAKANGLNPEKYLTYVMQVMPGKTFRDNPTMLEEFMPWSKEAQELCK